MSVNDLTEIIVRIACQPQAAIVDVLTEVSRFAAGAIVVTADAVAGAVSATALGMAGAG